MKKILKQFIVFICMVSMLMPCNIQPSQVSASSIQKFDYKTKSGFNSITLSWKAQKEVSYYNIYRMNITKQYYYGISPKEKEYKKIATVTNSKTRYVDRKVKRGVKYSYIIKGYKARKGKDFLVCTTLQRGAELISVAGLDQPILSGTGFGKYNNRLKYNYFSVSGGYGVEPTGYVIYRKKVGETGYKKVKLKKLSKGKFVDQKAEPGSIYKYKAKTYIKVGKKKYYSKKSSYLELNTTVYFAKYKVKLLNQPGIQTSVLSFQVTGKSIYNGSTIFYPKGALYYYQDSEDSEEYRCNLKLTQYSLDNKMWMEIPKNGIALKGKDTIYLRGDLFKDNAKESAYINFGESKPYQSYISFGDGEGGIAIQYKYRADDYYTEAAFDFVDGSGNAHQEGD